MLVSKSREVQQLVDSDALLVEVTLTTISRSSSICMLRAQIVDRVPLESAAKLTPRLLAQRSTITNRMIGRFLDQEDTSLQIRNFSRICSTLCDHRHAKNVSTNSQNVTDCLLIVFKIINTPGPGCYRPVDGINTEGMYARSGHMRTKTP